MVVQIHHRPLNVKMKIYDIIVISGGFDPIHRDHINLFRASKNLAHKVILGLNSDEWLVQKNGSVNYCWADRSHILSAIKYVDEVIHFNDVDGTAVDILTKVKQLYPTMKIGFANGGEINEDNLPEKGFCKAYGIDMLWNVGHKN
jgi:glycerol-3-phosphate cytidylyltransferase-like family protein